MPVRPSRVFAIPRDRRTRMLGRIFHPQPLDEPAFTRTALSYTQFDLAILSLCAQAIAYYVRTGFWPKLAPHTSSHAEDSEVWTQ